MLKDQNHPLTLHPRPLKHLAGRLEELDDCLHSSTFRQLYSHLMWHGCMLNHQVLHYSERCSQTGQAALFFLETGIVLQI